MSTNANATNALSLMQVAKLNEVTNVSNIEAKLPAYSLEETAIPVTVSFHQEFQKKEMVSVIMEYDEIETEQATNDKGELLYDEEGEAILHPVLVAEERQVKGKMQTVYVPKLKGTKGRKKTRVETGNFMNDSRRYDVRFICKDAKELRQEIGEAFTEFFGCLSSGEVNFAKSQKVHCTFNFSGKVLSSKYLSYGGIKLSKIFKKGILQKDKYSDEFCKPLFNQLKSVASGESNKPLEIDTAILNAIGLKEKE